MYAMPIVDIELITDEDQARVPRARISELADRLGELFGSPPGGTWVKLRYLPRSAYAESGSSDLRGIRPVFVSVTRAAPAPQSRLEEEAASVCEIVARVLSRRPENTHVVFEPPAAGRIAFGGKLRRE